MAEPALTRYEFQFVMRRSSLTQRWGMRLVSTRDPLDRYLLVLEIAVEDDDNIFP